MSSQIISRAVSDPVDIQIGARIRQRRRYLAMSQKQLGLAIGVAQQTVMTYESGEYRVSAATLLRIAKALEVSVIYFYEGIEG